MLTKEKQKEHNKKYHETHSEYGRKYREIHPEECREYDRRYRMAHPDRIRESNRKYHAAHPERHKKYREAHLEKKRESDRKYYKTHLKECNERNRKWRTTNPEKARVAIRKWNAANPERKRDTKRKWWAANPGWMNKYRKARCLSDEGFAVELRLRSRLLHAFNCYSKTGKLMKSGKYGVDWGKIIRHLGSCPGDRKDYEIDHIRPLSSFDFNDSEQVKQAFAPRNHQWLTTKENRRKGNKIEADSIQTKPF